MRRRLLPLLLLLVAFVGVGGPVVAATPDPVEDGVLTYAGTVEMTAIDPIDGHTEPRDPRPGEATVTCDADGCVASGWELSFVEIPLVDGRGESSSPTTGSVCDDTFFGARAEVVEVTATTLTWVIDEGPSERTECPEVTRIRWGIKYALTAELVSGDPCVLDGSCVLEEPAALPGPGTGSGPRDFATPTVFSELDTVQEAAEPANLLWAAVGTIILALLIAVPTYFFNASAETLSDRVAAWWHRIRKRPEAEERPGTRLGGWPLAAGGVALAAVVAAFADPAFGFDAAGLRVLLSILVSFGVEVVLGWTVVILLVRRTHPTASATFRFAPLTLLVVAAAVLLTRVTGFEPPIVFGLVAGVAFGGLLGTAEKARVALIGLGWAFGIGMLAWIAYSVLTASGATGDGAVFAGELLSSAAIAGISTLPIALLPLRGLAGRTVWEARRLVWVAAYAIGLFAFLLVLLPLPASWAEVGLGLWAWIGLYLLYAAAAAAVWLVVTRPWRREPAQA